MVAQEARRQGIAPSVALAVARQESNFDPAARSSAGAIGVMQLMPGTAADLGVNPYDLAENIRGGVAYLRQQYVRFGNWRQAFEAYNGGPGHVIDGTVSSAARLYAQEVQGRISAFVNFDAAAPGGDAWSLAPSEFVDMVFGDSAERPSWVAPAAAIGGAVLLSVLFG